MARDKSCNRAIGSCNGIVGAVSWLLVPPFLLVQALNCRTSAAKSLAIQDVWTIDLGQLTGTRCFGLSPAPQPCNAQRCTRRVHSCAHCPVWHHRWRGNNAQKDWIVWKHVAVGLQLGVSAGLSNPRILYCHVLLSPMCSDMP